MAQDLIESHRASVTRSPPSRTAAGTLVALGCLEAFLLSRPARAEEPGRDRRYAVEIPAQPLEAALEVYGRLTATALLVDQQLVAGVISSPVHGTYRADEALRALLAGTGLVARYAGTSALTLVRGSPAAREEPAPVPRELTSPHRFEEYFADLQESLVRALCGRPETEPGSFSLGLQLWLEPDGSIRAYRALGSTGDVRRDAAISPVLRAARLAPPPLDLPQPVTVAFSLHLPRRSSECTELEGDPP